jgi:ribonuclease HI
MKRLRLKPKHIHAISIGELPGLLLAEDFQDITVNDEVEVINDDTHEAIGSLTVHEVHIKRFEDFTNNQDALVREGSEQLVNPEALAKEINFSFKPYSQKHLVEESVVEMSAGITEVKMYADGGSRGNPGPSASGWVVFDLDDMLLKEGGFYLGITTNNQAEYTALKLGLEEAKHMGVKKVQVYMDSLLVINQMKGIFKVRNQDLLPIYTAIKKIVKDFEYVSFTHVPRALNKEADRMVNQTLDAL